MIQTLIPVLIKIGGAVALSVLIYLAIRFFAYKRSFPLPRRFDFLWLILTLLSIFLVSAVMPPLAGSVSPKFLTWTGFFAFLLSCYLLIFVVDQFLVEYFLMSVLKLYISPPLRKVMVLVIFLMAVLVGIQRIFHINPWAVYAPTSFLTLGIGIALKDTFQTFFAGVALSKIVRLGNWIQLDSREGEVIDINWARTVLRTKNGDHVFIPNSELQKGVFTNFSYQEKLHRCSIEVGVSYEAPPRKVKKILLECVQNVDGVLDHPEPDTYLVKYADSAVQYLLNFWTKDYAQWREISTEVSTRLWYAFKREGIEIPFPIRTLQITKKGRTGVPEMDAGGLLSQIDLFKVLSKEEKGLLLQQIRKQVYLKGEIIVRQNEAGSSLYIVLKGSVEILRHTKDGRTTTIGELKAGQFFGELSLLTGEPRTATVRALVDSELLCLAKEGFQEVMNRKPDLSESLAEVVVSRQASLTEHYSKEKEAEAVLPAQGKKGNISQKIRDFFNLRARV